MNKHYIPKYQGFVPRMNCENIIAKTTQKNQKEQIRIFDWKRFDKMDSQNPNTTRAVIIFVFIFNFLREFLALHLKKVNLQLENLWSLMNLLENLGIQVILIM